MVDVESGFSLRMLNSAIYDGEVEVVKYMLKHRKECEEMCNKKIDIHRKGIFDEEYNWTPIIMAIENGVTIQPEIIRMLIDDGANLSDEDNYGNVIIIQYCDDINGDADTWELNDVQLNMIKYMLDKMDKETIDKHVDKLFDKALMFSNVEFVMYLIDMGYKPFNKEPMYDSETDTEENGYFSEREKFQNKILKTLLKSYQEPKFHPDKKCAICLEEYDFDNDEFKLLRCGHIFHMDCFEKNPKKSCPTCRD